MKLLFRIAKYSDVNDLKFGEIPLVSQYKIEILNPSFSSDTWAILYGPFGLKQIDSSRTMTFFRRADFISV